MVKKNAKSEENKDGLLIQGEEPYLTHLGFSEWMLRSLLIDDEDTWKKRIDNRSNNNLA